MKSNVLARIPTGVEVITGIPGAGKSFVAVDELLRTILEDRRPVFTNLPMVFPVLRRWLEQRGGKPLAGLIYELDEEHFRAFLVRVTAYQKERNAAKVHAKRAGGVFNAGKFERDFCERHGPHILRRDPASDDTPNWILPTALTIVDEVHHWFSAKGTAAEKREPEPAELLSYITMLRHHCHRLLVLSQDKMQFTHTIRRLAKLEWRVSSQGEYKLAWGIKFKHLGIGGIRLEKWLPDADTSNVPELRVPRSVAIIFHSAPWHRWKFRLYESYTHAGSPRRMLRMLQESRNAAGLSDGGRLEHELVRDKVRRARKAQESHMSRRLVRYGRRLIILGVIGGAFAIGRAFSPASERLAAATATHTPLVWSPVDAYARDYVRIGTDRVRVLETHTNGTLVGVDARLRRAFWVRDGELWVQQHGASAVSAGDPGELLRRIRPALAADLGRRAQPLDPGDSAPTVEPSQGHD